MKAPALTTAQMREVDRLMIEDYGIALEQMMENAGRNLAELARRMLAGRAQGRRIAVLCGPGNNGGGGMVAARHLHNMGAIVSVVLAGKPDRLREVPAHQWAILRAVRLDRASFDLEISTLIVDALLGYGSKGDPRSPIKGWIERANDAGIPILALDSPSGLDTTTGQPGRPCIRAAATMALALPKTGLLAAPAVDFVGELHLADIGVPAELYGRLGLQVPLLFAEGAIVQLIDEQGN